MFALWIWQPNFTITNWKPWSNIRIWHCLPNQRYLPGVYDKIWPSQRLRFTDFDGKLRRCPTRWHEYHLIKSVYKKLKSLNSSRAPYRDGIADWVLKEYAESLASPISNLLNSFVYRTKVTTGLETRKYYSNSERETHYWNQQASQSYITHSDAVQKSLKYLLLRLM